MLIVDLLVVVVAAVAAWSVDENDSPDEFNFWCSCCLFPRPGEADEEEGGEEGENNSRMKSNRDRKTFQNKYQTIYD